MTNNEQSTTGGEQSTFYAKGITDNDLMKMAKRRVYARTAFRMHLIYCVLIGLLLTAIYLFTMPGGYFWPIWPMFGLGITLVIHGGIRFSIFNNDNSINEEYNRLKQLYRGEHNASNNTADFDY